MPHCARTRARAGAALGVASEHHGQERSHAHRDGLVRANADCEGEPLAGPGPRPCGKALRGATGSARMAQARRDGTGPRRLLSSKPPFPVRFLRLCALGTPKRARSAAWRMSRNQATSILRWNLTPCAARKKAASTGGLTTIARVIAPESTSSGHVIRRCCRARRTQGPLGPQPRRILAPEATHPARRHPKRRRPPRTSGDAQRQKSIRSLTFKPRASAMRIRRSMPTASRPFSKR